MCSGVVRARGWHFCQESGKIKSAEALHWALKLKNCVNFGNANVFKEKKYLINTLFYLKMDELFHNVLHKHLFMITIVLLFKRPKDFSIFKRLLFCNKISVIVTAYSCILLTCNWHRFDHDGHTRKLFTSVWSKAFLKTFVTLDFSCIKWPKFIGNHAFICCYFSKL